MSPESRTFTSDGVECAAWHWSGSGDAFATDRGRPCVVMAHGLGGTKDSGLTPYADAFAEAGLDVLAFDYRGFGESGGEPRQTVSLAGQLADYRAAMAAAARMDGVDPGRLVLWGVSLAGGHVLAAAAGRDDVAAVVSVVPLVDGPAAGLHALSSHRPQELLRSTALGVRGRLRERRGGEPLMMPLVGRPGELAAMTTPGAYEDYLSIAGPTWRNEVAASIVLQLGSHRPARVARDLRVPLLVQIADLDRSAPPHAAAKAAFAARAEVRRYPCDHFGVFLKPWLDAAIEHELHFLRRHLRATA